VRFFLWYLSNRHDILVLLFGIAIAFLLFGSSALDIGVTIAFMNAPIIKAPISQQLHNNLNNNDQYYWMSTTSNDLLNIAILILTISFIFFWIVSAVLLLRYSKRLGKPVVYRVFIIIPLVLVLVGVSPILQNFYNSDFAIIKHNMLLFRIIGTLSSMIGGLLFGVSFLILAKGMYQIQQNTIASYLNIAGYGIALMFLPLVANILFIPYPPFGAAAGSSLGLISFIFYTGLYSSVISIAEDAVIRKSIKGTVVKELEILDRMGTSQMNIHLENKVKNLVSNYSDEADRNVGVKPYFSENDIKQYLDEILTDLKEHKKLK
jgi:hypothetical protein